MYVCMMSPIIHRWLKNCAPLSSVMNQLEFRVLNILFCDSFSINRSIHFDEYIAYVLEKFILEIIEIRLRVESYFL